MRPFFPLLLLIATLVPVTSQARDCVPGYQEDTSRFTTEWIDLAGRQTKVVNDRATKLQWLYCPYGQSANDDGSCDGTPLFIQSKATLAKNPLMTLVSQANETLKSQTAPWRAPDIKELFTLYNNQCQPAIYLAYGHPSAEPLEQIEGEQAKICDKAKPVWDEKKKEFTDVDPSLEEACWLAKGQTIALKHLSFVSDSPSASGYNYLQFSLDGETFFAGGISFDGGMLRLVRPIPSASMP